MRDAESTYAWLRLAASLALMTLGGMRDRIKAMRKALAEGIRQRAPGADWSFVLQQHGLFSYTGLTKARVERLRSESSIYATETGRICVVAPNAKDIAYVCDAIAKVIRKNCAPSGSPIAQLVERRTVNPQVPGSSPGRGAIPAPLVFAPRDQAYAHVERFAHAQPAVQR